MNLFRNGDSATGRAEARAEYQAKHRAREIRRHGGNPVRVADVRQRHSTGTGQGQAVRTTLLSKLFG